MSVACRFVYHFSKLGSEKEKRVVVNDVQSTFKAYQVARSKMLEKTGLDIRTFESRWQVKESEIAVGVLDSPNKHTLGEKIQSINGVKSAELMRSEGEQNHIVYLLDLSDRINEDYVIDKIRTIIRGTTTDPSASKSEILIVFDPDYYWTDDS